ncbi:MAG: NPCBM/NEW2 domain-containing protein [Phycisphaerae bacterium]
MKNIKLRKPISGRRAFLKVMGAAAAAGYVAESSGRRTAWAAGEAGKQIQLSSLDIAMTTQELGEGRPMRNLSTKGRPISIGGVRFSNGLGTRANSQLIIDLHGQAMKFTALVGVDSLVENKGNYFPVMFVVVADQKVLAKTPVLRKGAPPYKIVADLRGAKTLVLIALLVEPKIIPMPWQPSEASTPADWADAVITMVPGATAMPVAMPSTYQQEIPEIASGDGKDPAIHGPRSIGTTPGRPFLFRVPVTGDGTIHITAEGLPTGLSLDTQGIITGSVATAGEYTVKLTAKSRLGTATRKLKVVAGVHTLAQTPSMGWNSWYVWGFSVTQEHVQKAADMMVKTGLAAKGYAYVNIDDAWAGPRDKNGNITADSKKFSSMKGLADYIHSKGLLFGIYSSPGRKTCAGYTGSYGHERQDAATWADWGVDFLKYDWCYYGLIAGPNPTHAEYVKPYAVMRTALDKVNRDIVYELCQYGMDDVWKWAAQSPVYANDWRVYTDLADRWGAVVGTIGVERSIYPYAGPGHWNFAEMLMTGWDPQGNNTLVNGLTPHEQLTQFTLWCLFASPLFLSCDLSRMDKFTLDLVSNTEVLDVDQDPLGRQARCVLRGTGVSEGDLQVWARQLWDGTMAVGLVNMSPVPQTIQINKWDDLKEVLTADVTIAGRQSVRDLWKRQNLGLHDGFSARIPAHSAMLLKVGKPPEL